MIDLMVAIGLVFVLEGLALFVFPPRVKQLLETSFTESLETQMELEARGIAAQVASKDGQEGMQAFVEKRTPEFHGE